MSEETKEYRKEFVDAWTELKPIIKTIPKDAIKRHNLLFETIVEDTINQNIQDYPELTLTQILETNLPYYINNGKI